MKMKSHYDPDLNIEPLNRLKPADSKVVYKGIFPAKKKKTSSFSIS